MTANGYWATRAERREERRRNARKMPVNGRSVYAIRNAWAKRAKPK